MVKAKSKTKTKAKAKAKAKSKAKPKAKAKPAPKRKRKPTPKDRAALPSGPGETDILFEFAQPLLEIAEANDELSVEAMEILMTFAAVIWNAFTVDEEGDEALRNQHIADTNARIDLIGAPYDEGARAMIRARNEKYGHHSWRVIGKPMVSEDENGDFLVQLVVEA